MFGYRVIRYSIFLLLLVHWTGCVHFIIPVYLLHLTNGSISKSWIFTEEVLNNSNLGIYIDILFRSISIYVGMLIKNRRMRLVF